MTENTTEESPHNTRWVQEWQPSDTLVALRRLLDTSARVPPALARRTGLSHTETAVMEYIIENVAGPSELAHRLGVTSAAASGIVDRLVTRGHVERRAHPTDRRRTVVAATPAGQEELLSQLMPMFRELARIDEGLSPSEREIVVRFLAAAEGAVRRLI